MLSSSTLEFCAEVAVVRNVVLARLLISVEGDVAKEGVISETPEYVADVMSSSTQAA